MSRGRILKVLLAFVGALGLASVLMVPVSTQGPGNGQGLQIGVHNGRQVAAGEVLVRLREEARRAPFSQDLDVDRDELVGDGSIRRIHSRSHNVETLLARLAESEDVEYAEPNYLVYALATPDDPLFPLLWGLLNTGQTVNKVAGTPDADIKVTQAWDLTMGSRANVVGVVDTGIDYNHADLAANAWTATSSFSPTIGGRTIACAPGWHGFNAITMVCDPMDDNGHGTHVSGTIGAVGNNRVGVVGVNWTANIMGLKFLDASGSGLTSDAINAIEFAIQAKKSGVANVRVLSNSWGGGGFSQALLDEINLANGYDILFPVAAGNNRSNNDRGAYYPANYDAPNIIAVAATDSRDGLASFSNYGATTVDLGAPGVNIASTYPGNQYVYMSGTSMATPHVSGTAALVLSACDRLSVADLKNVILANVDVVPGLVGKVATNGRLNAYKAVNNCGGTPASEDFSIGATPVSQSIQRGGSTTYTVTIGAINGFQGSVGFGVTGLPAGATTSFDPTAVSGAGPTTLTVTTPSSTKVKTYTLKITGTSGTLVHSTTVKLSVTR